MLESNFIYALALLLSFSSEQIREDFGGKTFGLVEAYHQGILIPKTWVVSSRLYTKYLKLHQNLSNKNSIISFLDEHLSQEIEKLPDIKYIVRSSSAFEDSSEKSFAGVFDSIANVSKKNLVKAISEVWLSSQSNRVAKYSDSSKNLKMGVILQPYLSAKKAGIAFSAHPSPTSVFENDTLVIEYANTAGEDIVQGKITPKKIQGSSKEILATNPPAWIKGLLKALITLKNHHKSPVDVEFVQDKNDLYIVQQRPVSRVYRSNCLNLENYERKYKRSLHSLDIEILIRGCAKYLSDYLDAPFFLEKWMVMITNHENVQELWVNKDLDKKILQHVLKKSLNETNYLKDLEEKYFKNHKGILKHDYLRYSSSEIPLSQRFKNFYDFIVPMAAHYYVPMFVIDALHSHLLKHFKSIDADKGEDDLFSLTTSRVSSLVDILNKELETLKKSQYGKSQAFSKLDRKTLSKLEELSDIYGFLKCREPFEQGYTSKDLFDLSNELATSDRPCTSPQKTLEEKYLVNAEINNIYKAFLKWLNIRNQEMEFFGFALYRSKPLFTEISNELSTSAETLWKSSFRDIYSALASNADTLNPSFKTNNLVIYHHLDVTHLTNSVEVYRPSSLKKGLLKGNKVYGTGKKKAKVVVAFSPQEIQNYPFSSENYVLVTGMTTPDFIPFISKHFCAVITDEGGILCHAAILARENQIPCLVGTEFGSEKLKNDDMVEIDFNSGSVRVL